MIGIDRASLMSSVFGLNDNPNMAIFFPFNSVSFSFAFSTACFAWFSLTSWTVWSMAGL